MSQARRKVVSRGWSPLSFLFCLSICPLVPHHPSCPGTQHSLIMTFLLLHFSFLKSRIGCSVRYGLQHCASLSNAMIAAWLSVRMVSYRSFGPLQARWVASIMLVISALQTVCCLASPKQYLSDFLLPLSIVVIAALIFSLRPEPFV